MYRESLSSHVSRLSDGVSRLSRYRPGSLATQPAPVRARQFSPSQHKIPLLVGALCLFAALALAGCGATTIIDSPGNTSGPTQPPIPGVGGGGATAVRPCTASTTTPSKTPTIVLTVNQAYKTTQARVGDVIEVRLDTVTRWSPPANKGAAVLLALQPQGGMDATTHTCRWLFAVTGKGSVTLSFTGSPVCESNAPCPAIARFEQFTIQAS